MSRKPKQEESGPKVPTYIVTFSDMVTLLLTFFVMLLSMAETQVEDHKFLAGRSSFQRAVADFGLTGFLINKHSGPQFQHPKPQYRVDEGEDKPEDRSVDAHTEMIRRILMDIESQMDISPSHITGKSKTFLPTNIRFPKDSFILDEQNKTKLNRYWMQTKNSISDVNSMIYVVGFGADASTTREQFIISSKRASAVADYLKELNDSENCSIFSWGAGSGGDWTGKNGITSKDTHIVITIIAQDD